MLCLSNATKDNGIQYLIVTRTKSRVTPGERGTAPAKKERTKKRYRLLSYVVARVFANYLERLVDSNWTLRWWVGSEMRIRRKKNQHPRELVYMHVERTRNSDTSTSEERSIIGRKRGNDLLH